MFWPIFANSCGMLGVVIILLAYALLQTGKMLAKSFIYSFINLIGSCLILISLMHHWNLPSFIIEIAWIIISLWGMYRSFRLMPYQNTE